MQNAPLLFKKIDDTSGCSMNKKFPTLGGGDYCTLEGASAITTVAVFYEFTQWVLSGLCSGAMVPCIMLVLGGNLVGGAYFHYTIAMHF